MSTQPISLTPVLNINLGYATKNMNTLIKKARLIVLTVLAILFGQILILFSIFGPCYNSCTFTSFFETVRSELPISLLTLFFLLCAALLHIVALYIFVTVFITRLKVYRWMHILLTIAITPMLLLSLLGLVFDSGDIIIYTPVVTIAAIALVVIWYPNIQNCLRARRIKAKDLD